MSTEATTNLTHRILTNGTDSNGRRIEGNVAILAPIPCPVDIPAGAPGPIGTGDWTVALWIEDPGGRPVRYLDCFEDDEPLVLDPAEVVEDQAGPGDLYHLAVQFAEPVAA